MDNLTRLRTFFTPPASPSLPSVTPSSIPTSSFSFTSSILRPSYCPCPSLRYRRQHITLFFILTLCLVATVTVILTINGHTSFLLPSSWRSPSSLLTSMNKDNGQRMLESQMLARAWELDVPATRNAMAKYTGIGRYSDRARYWYILARDVILQRPNATLTRYNNHAYMVVFGTTWFGSLHKWATGYTECPPPSPHRYPKNKEKGCVISFYPDYMKSLLPYADMVLYHRATQDEAETLPPRIPYRKNQRHALITAEHFPSMFNPKIMNRFNTEVSFRQRSLFRDGGYELLGLGYADRWHLQPPASGPSKKIHTWNDLFLRKLIPTNQRFRMQLPDRTASTVTWASTHCESHSGRESFIRKLQTFFPIHIFGDNCLTNMNSEETYPWASQTELFRNYKFHLALENTRCNDYVTEKIFLALARGQVPVYLGAPNIDEFMPSIDSYINIINFASVKELADYLIYLDSHDEEYEKYFAWRNRPYTTYGKVLRQVIDEVLPLGNNTGPGAPGQPIWYKCSMCYALQYEEILQKEKEEEDKAGRKQKETTDQVIPQQSRSKIRKPSSSSSSLLETVDTHPLEPVPVFECEPGIEIVGQDTDLSLNDNELALLTDKDKNEGKILHPDNLRYPFRWKKPIIGSSEEYDEEDALDLENTYDPSMVRNPKLKDKQQGPTYDLRIRGGK